MVDAYCRRGRSADVHLSIIGVRVADEAGTRDDGEQYLRYVEHIFIGSHGKCQGHEHMQFENGKMRPSMLYDLSTVADVGLNSRKFT